MAFFLGHFNLVYAKPLFLEIPLLRSQVFDQYSQVNESQSKGDAFEPEKNISQESNITSDVKEFLEIPNAHNRTTRSTHPCVLSFVRVYDSCRKIWVQRVECDSLHPACNHVIPIHRRPKCQTVYSTNVKCPSLPIDCKCAS